MSGYWVVELPPPFGRTGGDFGFGSNEFIWGPLGSVYYRFLIQLGARVMTIKYRYVVLVAIMYGLFLLNGMLQAIFS